MLVDADAIWPSRRVLLWLHNLQILIRNSGVFSLESACQFRSCC